MTAAQRQRIRAARDAHVRATVLAVNAQLVGVLFCGGCGMELNDWTPGCRRCTDRWWGYRRRGLVSEHVYQEKAAAGKIWGVIVRERSNTEKPRRGRKPASTWAQHREALGVKNGGRLLRTPRGFS